MIIFIFIESPSRAQWDDDEFDRRSQWEHPSPNDNYNRQGYRRQRDTDYYNRYNHLNFDTIRNFELVHFHRKSIRVENNRFCLKQLR